MLIQKPHNFAWNKQLWFSFDSLPRGFTQPQYPIGLRELRVHHEVFPLLVFTSNTTLRDIM